MNARKIAAQFAAYSWYEEVRGTTCTDAEAVRFAKKNWKAFEAVAPEGFGRLLARIGRRSKTRELAGVN